MLSVMEVKSTRILPCAMSNAACAAMRMTPEDAICFTSCCFRWDSSSWDFLLRQKLTMGFSMILVMTLKLTRKSHLQDRSDLRMISDDNDWLPFDPFVLFFLCAMPWLWRPHQSMPWFSEPTPSKLLRLHNMLQVCHAVLFQALSLSLLQSSNDNLAPNLPVQSSHPKIPATPIFHALVAAADVQSSSLFPVLWLHAIRRKPEQYEIGNAAHPILNHPLLGPVYIILPILKVLELESGGFCWVYQGLSWFKANQKTHPKCIPCANGLTPAWANKSWQHSHISWNLSRLA